MSMLRRLGLTRRISLKRKDHALCQGIKHDQNSAENTYPQVRYKRSRDLYYVMKQQAEPLAELR